VGRKMYERSTRRCAASSLDQELRAAIAAHAEQHQLGDVVGDAVECCETRSVRLAKPGLLSRLTGSGDKDTEHRTVALYTPTYLVVATTGEVRGIHVRSARLEDVTLGQIGGALAAKAAELGADEGVSVTALWSGATGDQGPAAFFVALDHAQGDTFRSLLAEGVTSAKRH
jgi:hypothetical protein